MAENQGFLHIFMSLVFSAFQIWAFPFHQLFRCFCCEAMEKKKEIQPERPAEVPERGGYAGYGMCIGLCLGLSVGLACGQMVIGMAAGMCLGLAAGAVLQCMRKK